MKIVDQMGVTFSIIMLPSLTVIALLKAVTPCLAAEYMANIPLVCIPATEEIFTITPPRPPFDLSM